MLNEIEKSHAELHQLNQELERCVLKRTAQLETANKELETLTLSV